MEQQLGTANVTRILKFVISLILQLKRDCNPYREVIRHTCEKIACIKSHRRVEQVFPESRFKSRDDVLI